MRFRAKIAPWSDRCVAKWIPGGGADADGRFMHWLSEARDVLSFLLRECVDDDDARGGDVILVGGGG